VYKKHLKQDKSILRTTYKCLEMAFTHITQRQQQDKTKNQQQCKTAIKTKSDENQKHKNL